MFFFRNRYFITVAALSLSLLASAQQPDSVISLREVAIIASPVRQVATTSFNEQIPTVIIADYSTQSVSELLARTGAVITNQYGPGGLATVSLRGAGSSQTAILWNGLNLQSPMNGGINLSQLPVNFIDEIEINHGGQSAQQGSGAIGGVVQLTSKADLPAGLSVGINQLIGSFGTVFTGLKVRYGSSKLSFSTRLFRQSAVNDFSFINTASYGKPEMKQPNADLLQYGVLQTGLWQINSRQQLIVRLWAQHYDKLIPPMMTNLDSRQQQIDDDYRGAAEWTGRSGRFQWVLRSGYLFNKQLYSDDASALKANNSAASWQNNFEAMMRLDDYQRIVIQTGTTFETGKSDHYNEPKKRNITWLMTGYRVALTHNKAVFTANIREELSDMKPSTPTFSVGTDVLLWPGFTLNSNVARSYRIPTLNDLYWNIWGNPDLKPEQGYTLDFGINFNKKWGEWQAKAGLTSFSNHISEWIIWLPKGSIWTPENLKKVWARGIESQISIDYTTTRFLVGVAAKYHYTRATQLANDENALDESLQLIYTPQHHASFSVSGGYRWFDVRIDQSLTGSRFTDAANRNNLDGYTVSDLSIGAKYQFRSCEAAVRCRINNLTNEQYQAVAWYAMPSRHFQISITLLFN